MRIYQIKITMPDGSKGTYTGLFADGFDAVQKVMTDFPQAKRISALHVPKNQGVTHAK